MIIEVIPYIMTNGNTCLDDIRAGVLWKPPRAVLLTQGGFYYLENTWPSLARAVPPRAYLQSKEPDETATVSVI